MAISAAVFVGGFDKWKQPLIDAAKSLKVSLADRKGWCCLRETMCVRRTYWKPI